MRRIAVTAVALGALVAPAVPAVAAPQPVLTTGMSAPAVKRVQKSLSVAATGYFGPLTLKAVKSYQQAHGLPVTGVVGPMTWSALTAQKGVATKKSTKKAAKKKAAKQKKHRAAKKKAARAAAANPFAASTVQYGDRGDAVLFLQQQLGVQPQTGYFGPITKSYVEALQAAAKLPVTGVVDAATWRKVGKVSFTPPAPPAPPTTSTSLPAPSNATAAEILRIAASQAGVPYVASGNSPATGFNCSSYTQWVFEQVGINLGGAYTVTQYDQATHISADQAKPGDLVFFYNYANNFIGHVGIYAGNGMMWHAPRTGRVVSLEKVYTDKVYYARVLAQ